MLLDARQDRHAGGTPGGHRSRTAALALGALGIVYGDIGTSPLYAMRETLNHADHPLGITEANVLGILSLVFWALVLVISVKYLWLILRADNNGEGGILALAALLRPPTERNARRRTTLVLAAIFGCALLYGDGMITPAISVLSAVEGTKLVSPTLSRFVVPLAVGILIALFLVQKRGTGAIGRAFGPVMVLWFGVLGLLGVLQIAENPSVLRALNPAYGATFVVDNAWIGFLALGSVFLVVTGGEALYADMGHFGARPIRWAWFCVALPGLLLNYLGQGALLLADPSAIDNPFYRLAPEWALVPMVALATSASIIASQALISGVYSLTAQAVQLGYIPRLRIRHTSAHERGQIYVPTMNWALMVACIALVVGFRSSSNLASAYGLAVTATMAVTTALFFVVLRERFGWPLGRTVVVCGSLLVIDLVFLTANVLKIPDGGWFPLAVGIALFTLMTTWRTGRRLVAERLLVGRLPLERFVASVMRKEPVRVPGSAVFLFSTPRVTPPSLLANLRHNSVLHERVVVLSILTEDVPSVLPVRRFTVEDHGHHIYGVVAHYGFMEEPDVARDLDMIATRLGLDLATTTYFLGRENLRVTDRPGMAAWREHLFLVMSRNATSAAQYFGVPIDRTVEVGIAVEL